MPVKSFMLIYKLIGQHFEVIPLEVHIDIITGNIFILTEQHFTSKSVE